MNADAENPHSLVRDKVESVLGAATSLFLATHSRRRGPWNAGTFYAVLNPFRLTLILELGGATLGNLRSDPAAAVVIAPAGPFAPFLQGAAHARIREPGDTDETVAALLAAEPGVRPLIEAGPPVAAVDLHIDRWRVTDVAAGWLPGRELRPEPTTPITPSTGLRP